VNRILIVEADRHFRERLTSGLAGEHMVRAVAEGREAVDLIRQSMVDVVLLDGVVRDGGLTVLGCVAGMDPRPSILVLSELNQPAMAVKAMKLGASDYLVKPCGLDAVRKAIRDVIASRPSRAA